MVAVDVTSWLAIAAVLLAVSLLLAKTLVTGSDDRSPAGPKMLREAALLEVGAYQALLLAALLLADGAAAVGLFAVIACACMWALAEYALRTSGTRPDGPAPENERDVVLIGLSFLTFVAIMLTDRHGLPLSVWIPIYAVILVREVLAWRRRSRRGTSTARHGGDATLISVVAWGFLIAAILAGSLEMIGRDAKESMRVTYMLAAGVLSLWAGITALRSAKAGERRNQGLAACMRGRVALAFMTWQLYVWAGM